MLWQPQVSPCARVLVQPCDVAHVIPVGPIEQSPRSVWNCEAHLVERVGGEREELAGGKVLVLEIRERLTTPRPLSFDWCW